MTDGGLIILEAGVCAAVRTDLMTRGHKLAKVRIVCHVADQYMAHLACVMSHCTKLARRRICVFFHSTHPCIALHDLCPVGRSRDVVSWQVDLPAERCTSSTCADHSVFYTNWRQQPPRQLPVPISRDPTEGVTKLSCATPHLGILLSTTARRRCERTGKRLGTKTCTARNGGCEYPYTSDNGMYSNLILFDC